MPPVDKCSTGNRPRWHVLRTLHWLHIFSAFFCSANVSNIVINVPCNRVHFIICEVNSLCQITENSSNMNFLYAFTNPRGTQHLLDGFSWYFIPEDFLKICCKKFNSDNNGTLQLAEFYLEWEMFHIEVAEEIRIHFMFKTFSENCAVYEMWKNMLHSDGPQIMIYYCACTLHAE